MLSRAYQLPSVPRAKEIDPRATSSPARKSGALTAEQFADAIGAITGEWGVAPVKAAPRAGAAASQGRAAIPPSQPRQAGMFAREWRVASSSLTRALGRPIRDQINSTRATDATTPQALELINGELLSTWLSRGARRMLGELPPDPVSLYNRAVAGRTPTSSAFDVDITGVRTLWLVVQDTGSNVPEAIMPAWARAELVGPSGPVPLTSLTPADPAGLRQASGPLACPTASGDGLRVANPSVLSFDIAGKGYTRFRGVIGLENSRQEIGSTLNPATRFFVFDTAPDLGAPDSAAARRPARRAAAGHDHRRGSRSRVPAGARTRAHRRRAHDCNGRAPRSGARRQAVAAGARRPAVGCVDEAGSAAYPVGWALQFSIADCRLQILD